MKYSHSILQIEFTDACLAELASRRQLLCISRENGGQLFARIEGDCIRVEAATVTKGRSRRARLGFWPDRLAERADIQRMYEQGLHYVGDWHTHPEPSPQPSSTDKSEMLDIFRRSRHELPAMLLVIVGQTPFPRGLFVGAVMESLVVSLHADATQASKPT